MTAVWSVIIALAIGVVFLSLLVVGLLRSHAEIIRRLDSLGVRLDGDERGGAPIALSTTRAPRSSVPGLAGVSPDGEPLVLSPVVGEDPVLLAFLSTTCSSCTVFWEWFTSPTVEVEGQTYRVIVATLGADEESPTRALSLKRGTVDVVMSSSSWQDYEVPGAPYFALVDPLEKVVVGEGTAPTVEALKGFLRDSTGDRAWDRSRRVIDRTDKDRERMVDEELRRAGIYPGDPSLYPERQTGPDEERA